MRIAAVCCLVLVVAAHAGAQQMIRFAAIGDYGYAGQPESDVAGLVMSWNPDFVITLGDNNYDNGSAATIDQNIGQYYHPFISPYTGSYGSGDTVNRFFPSLGNHDWRAAGAQPYLNFFALPGNERYYEYVMGPVHFFVLDSDTSEPDGRTAASLQAQWLSAQMAASTAPWKLVYFHHPPYNSGAVHGSTFVMRWPFADWGAAAVLAGHEHIYERVMADGIVYFVNGLGGRSIYSIGAPVPGSARRYNGDYGAMLVTASDDSIVFEFRTRNDSLIDRYSIVQAPSAAAAGDVPGDFSLSEAYPNPFNPATTLVVTARQRSHARLDIVDLLGRAAGLLLDGPVEPGEYRFTWDARGLPSGIYLARLTTGEGKVLVRTVALVR